VKGYLFYEEIKLRKEGIQGRGPGDC